MKTTRVDIQLPTELHETTLKEPAALRLEASAGWQNSGEGQPRDPIFYLLLHRGESELQWLTDRACMCSNRGNHVFQLSHSAAFGEQELTAALQAWLWDTAPSWPHRQNAAARAPWSFLQSCWGCAETLLTLRCPTVGKGEMAFQTCVFSPQISNFSCPRRKGQYKEQKKNLRFFSSRGIFLTLEVTNFIVVD